MVCTIEAFFKTCVAFTMQQERGWGGHCRILKKKGAGGVGVKVGGFFNLYTAGHPITPSKSICIFARKVQATFLFLLSFLIYFIFFDGEGLYLKYILVEGASSSRHQRRIHLVS